ncbi:hypothetical protein DOY81_006915 [Sarcophaga bullata]|nr:hypothetical protein DOY81_006915 [Sarcophaga bullata]
MCWLLAGIFCLAFADIKYEENIVEKVNTQKRSESKPKRDASLLLGGYHGPSYKYLPPSSVTSYDTHIGSLTPSSGIFGMYNSGNGNNYGHKSGHFGSLAQGNQNSGIVHSVGYTPKNSYQSNNHHDSGYTTIHSTGHGSVPQLSGTKGNDGSLSSGSFDHGGFTSGRINTNTFGHKYSISGYNGFKPNSHFIIGGHLGQSSSFGNRYYHPKVLSGSFPSSDFSGHGFDHILGSSQPVDLTEVHHGDHVHNGGQEHLYNVPSRSTNFENGHQGIIELPSVSYSTPVRQHPLPSSSYEVPIENVGDIYKKKINQYASVTQGPTYAAGHKGLGHFSFISNKPQVLHTSISGLSFQQPSPSKAPFKPSTFLGAKYEETSNDNFVSQQRLPPTLVRDITGYDYPIPPDSSVMYQQDNYAQSLEVPSASIREPDSTYQSPNSNESSFKDITLPVGHYYLPPDNNFEDPLPKH